MGIFTHSSKSSLGFQLKHPLTQNRMIRVTTSLTASTSDILLSRPPPLYCPPPACCLELLVPMELLEVFPWKRQQVLKSLQLPTQARHRFQVSFPHQSTVWFPPMHSGHLCIEPSYEIQGSGRGLHEFALHLLLQTIYLITLAPVTESSDAPRLTSPHSEQWVSPAFLCSLSLNHFLIHNKDSAPHCGFFLS